MSAATSCSPNCALICFRPRRALANRTVRPQATLPSWRAKEAKSCPCECRAARQRIRSLIEVGGCRSSGLPVDKTSALVAHGELPVGTFAARGGFDLVRNLEMATAALAAADRDDRRQALRRNAVVKLEFRRTERAARCRDFAFHHGVLGLQ